VTVLSEPVVVGKEQYGFVYGDEHVAYCVERRAPMEGQPRKIGIEVNSDCQVKVLAPEDAKRADIHDAVMNRAKWIHDSLHAFKERRAHVQPRRYVSGEMQFYLGQPQARKAEQVRTLVNQWYRVRAEQVFSTRLNKLLPKTRWVKGTPDYRILAMEKRSRHPVTVLTTSSCMSCVTLRSTITAHASTAYLDRLCRSGGASSNASMVWLSCC